MRRCEVNIQLRLENGTGLVFSTINNAVHNMLRKRLHLGGVGTMRLHLILLPEPEKGGESQSWRAEKDSTNRLSSGVLGRVLNISPGEM